MYRKQRIFAFFNIPNFKGGEMVRQMIKKQEESMK
jgi:hypothetical protein